MTNYRRGADFERKVKQELERCGWLVIRSAGSKGKADLVAIAPGGNVVLMQCKRDARISASDRGALVEQAMAFDCIPVLAHKGLSGIDYLELFNGSPIPWHPGGEI